MLLVLLAALIIIFALYAGITISPLFWLLIIVALVILFVGSI